MKFPRMEYDILFNLDTDKSNETKDQWKIWKHV